MDRRVGVRLGVGRDLIFLVYIYIYIYDSLV